MKELKIYRVTDEYIAFLQKEDSRVQNNKSRKRPYVGVVLYVGEYKYFVPMESPKPNHANLKNGKHLFKIDNGSLGLLGFNNMIPVKDCALVPIDLSLEDRKYAELLKRQSASCNRSKAEIFNKASRTYYDVINSKNKFLMQICCDFKKLEEACDRYGDKL